MANAIVPDHYGARQSHFQGAASAQICSKACRTAAGLAGHRRLSRIAFLAARV